MGNPPSTLTCLIIDDEPIARQGIADYVAEVTFLELAQTCKNALEANQVLNEQTIDLLFLDIQMPHLNGLDFLKSLEHSPLVILTTAYREYAWESYELNVLDYLVKPIAFPRFLKAANKALNYFQSADNLSPPRDPHFFIKSDGKLTKIQLNDILYIEGLKDYIFIHTAQERHLVLTSLKNAEQQLPSERFLRVHRSFIVALDKVNEIEGNVLKINNKQVPLSKNMREEVYQKIIGDKLWKRH